VKSDAVRYEFRMSQSLTKGGMALYWKVYDRSSIAKSEGNFGRRTLDEDTRFELKQERGAFLKQKIRGNHAGGGILGRTPEFPVRPPGL